MKPEIVKLGKLEIDLQKLAEFIVKGKKNCYAGKGEGKKLDDGSRLLTFQEGKFHYEDNYDGWYQAPGRELVRWGGEKGQRIWQMSYSGGVYPRFWDNQDFIKAGFGFLKECLMKVELSSPFRGKEKEIHNKRIDKNHFMYQCLTKGDIEDFNGREHMWVVDKGGIFTQHYNGGLINPK